MLNPLKNGSPFKLICSPCYDLFSFTTCILHAFSIYFQWTENYNIATTETAFLIPILVKGSHFLLAAVAQQTTACIRSCLGTKLKKVGAWRQST